MSAPVFQASIPCFEPEGDGDGANPSSLPFEIGGHPAGVTHLDGFDRERRKLLPA
jgi:hypothetical protein